MRPGISTSKPTCRCSQWSPSSPLTLHRRPRRRCPTPRADPTNAVAAIGWALDTFWVGLVNFFEQGNNYISQIGEIQQQVAQQADQTQPVANKVIAPMLTLFNTLNSAGPECVALGFTQCAFWSGRWVPHPAWFSRSPIRSIRVRRSWTPTTRRASFEQPHAGRDGTRGDARRHRHRHWQQLSGRHDDLAQPRIFQHLVGQTDRGPGAIQRTDLPRACAARIVDERTCSLHLQSHRTRV